MTAADGGDQHGTDHHDAELAALISLIRLPGVGPVRLNWLLSCGTARVVLAELRAGRLPVDLPQAPFGVTQKLVNEWVREARIGDPSSMLERERADITAVLAPGAPAWPFADDPEPPLVVFAQGDLDLLDPSRPRVAIVGTRRCTSVGRRVAHDLGAGLAAAGVDVVSGLASGIDTAAHVGALEAGGRPIAVIATGLDVVYPAANRSLVSQVRREGLVLTEACRGTKPERWRFPARNRLIASLVRAVVVVESHAEGGSLHTVDEAIERGRLVLAVPGATTSPASQGTNQLLVDGAPPVRHAADVLDSIGWLAPPGPHPVPELATSGLARPTETAGPGPEDPLSRWVLGEVRAGPCHLDALATEATRPVADVLSCVHSLVEAGLVVLDGGTVSLRQQPPR